MSDLLFNTPWWLPTVIVAAGVALWVNGNNRSLDSLKRLGLGIAGVGLLLAIVSYFVDTDREKVTDQSSRLVQSVVSQDWATVESLLHPKVIVSVGGSRFAVNRDAVMELTKRRTGEIGVRSAFITSNVPERRPPMLTSSLRVFAELDKLAGQQVPSDWQIDWEKSEGRWVATELRAVRLGNASGEDAKSQLGR